MFHNGYRKVKADIKINRELNNIGKKIDSHAVFLNKQKKSEENAIKTIASWDEEKIKKMQDYNSEKRINSQKNVEALEYIEQNRDKLKEALLKEAEISGAEHALKIYEEELKIFKDRCITYHETLNARIHSTHSSTDNSTYLKFLIELAKSNKQFYLYSPIEIFIFYNRPTLADFNKNELDILKDNFEKAGAFSRNYKYFSVVQKNYLKFFPDKIRLIDDPFDLAYALKLDSSKYPIVRDSFINDSTGTFVNFTYLINSAPNVIKYFGKEEFEILANNSIKGLDKALCKNPDNINYFPNNFFDNYETIKSVFRSAPKTKLIEIFGDRLDRFPALKSYAIEKARKYPKVITSDKDEYGC